MAFPVVLLVATRREGLTDHVVGIFPTVEDAERQAERIAVALRADHVRTIVRPATLDHAEVTRIVEGWGREDAASNCHGIDPDAFPLVWRDAYLRAYHDAK